MTHRQVFVGLYVKDSRLSLGSEYYKDPLYATPLAFDIVSEDELKAATQAVSQTINGGTLQYSMQLGRYAVRCRWYRLLSSVPLNSTTK